MSLLILLLCPLSLQKKPAYTPLLSNQRRTVSPCKTQNKQYKLCVWLLQELVKKDIPAWVYTIRVPDVAKPQQTISKGKGSCKSRVIAECMYALMT